MVFREMTTLEKNRLGGSEVEVRVGRLKNGKVPGKDGVTGEMPG